MNHLRGLAALLFAIVSSTLAAPTAAAGCDYHVRVQAGPALAIEVQGRCPDLAVDALRFVYPRSAPFAVVAPFVGDGRIRYRFDIDGFVEASDNYRVATRRDGARMLTLASWLAVPSSARADTRIRLDVDAAGTGFSSALPADGRRLFIDVGDLRRSGYTVFGEFASRSIELPGSGADGASVIEVVDLRGGGDDLVPWVRDTAVQVTRYFGRFPVPRLLLALLGTGGSGIDYGRVVSGGGATMLLVVGESATRESLYGEWVLVHELLHLGSPFMPDGFWFMEGFATYAEPIIRARAGWRSERSVWNEFYRDMPHGVPALTEEGLGNTRSGMYWGGALFMLLADREYRRISGGGKGLGHCIRAVLDSLGNSTVSDSVVRVMAVCDEQFGSPVMHDLAARHVHATSPFHIDALWRDLGLGGPRGNVRLDDDAPDATIRRDIVRRGPEGELPMDDNAPEVVR